MAEISAQLRQFSRKSGSSLTAVSVQACFRYALRLYQNRLHDVEVVRDWGDEVWVHADLVRLEQVLVNLIGNALQAMAETPEPTLILSVEVEAERVFIGVSDSGPGIPELTWHGSSSPSSLPSRRAAGWGWDFPYRRVSSGIWAATSMPAT